MLNSPSVNPGLTTLKRPGALLAGLSGLLFFVCAPLISGPQTASADEPVITYQYPEEGDVLKEPPFVLAMCFEEPVNVNDLDKGGDFRFRLLGPDNKGLGMRIVFQPDGYGVAIYPGLPQDEQVLEGEWTWEYRLTDRVETSDATEGVVKFSVSAADGKEIISATPPACLASGATPAPTPIRPGTPGPTGGPTATPDEGETPGPENTPGNNGQGGTVDEEGDSDVDILRLALLTIGAAGAAAVLALIGYVVRKRIGYEPHAPHGDEGPTEHH